ncbi:MAG: hypothetical protein ACLRMM_04720 [Ruminococcus callidus]|uniref:hypothetical protein n=1 Tax=Ruminococcus callidus TaxID=40519 RepID=UPI0039A00595
MLIEPVQLAQRRGARGNYHQRQQQRKAEEHLLAAAEIARVSGISLESLVQALTIFYREEE